MFSKLVTKSKIPKPLSIQLRSLQYKPRYSHPGFLESITGSMEDPRQKLELKPTEWRDGSLRQFTDHFPIMFLIIVCGAPIVLCFFSLFWYSITDSAVTNNIHPHLKIQSSDDHRKTQHPVFILFNPYSTSMPSPSLLFHDEIEQAIATRRREKKN